MFNKYLCKRFQGKTVTLGGLICAFIAKYHWSLLVCIMGILMWVCLPITRSLPLWTIVLSPLVGGAIVALVFSGVYSSVIIAATLTYVLERISKIKIAECPLKKEEK